MKNKVILIHPSDEVMLAVYPLSCLILAGVLLAHGFEPVIFNQNVDGDFVDFLDEHLSSALCVGISSITGVQIKNGLTIARKVRNRDDQMRIVWGGWHPSALPEQTLQDPLVDIVVRDEGECSFLEIVQCLKNGTTFNNVLGISYKAQSGELFHNPDRPFVKDLDSLPKNPWHLIDINKTVGNASERCITIQTGRGCPAQCTFCSHKKGMYRPFSAKYILDNLEPAIRKHDIKKVYFFEPTLVTSQTRVLSICNEIISRGLDIRWSASARASNLAKFDDFTMETMQKSGCSELTFGFESASQLILDKINKKINLEQIMAAIIKCKHYNIMPDACFIVGFPFETFYDVLDTLTLIAIMRKFNPNVRIHVQLYTAFPATELYEECIAKYGLKRIEQLHEWGNFSTWKNKRPWLGAARKAFLKMLNGSIYASSLSHLKSHRKDLKFIVPLHLLTVACYNTLYYLNKINLLPSHKLALKLMRSVRPNN